MSSTSTTTRLHSALLQCALLLALSFSTPRAAEAANPPAGDPTREIFELSSLRPQLQLVGYQLDEWVLAQSANVPPMRLAVLRTEIARQYSAASLESEILPRIRAKLQRAYAAKVLAWLRSPLGKRVNARDTATASAESSQAIVLYLDELRQHPAPPERKKLIDRLIVAIRHTEVTTDMGLSIAQGLVLGLQATGPAETRADPSLVRSQIESTRAQAIAEGAELSVASRLYTYRNLSDEDLLGLVEFAESDAGRWYHDTVWTAALEALDTASLNLQKQVVAEIARQEAAAATSR